MLGVLLLPLLLASVLLLPMFGDSLLFLELLLLLLMLLVGAASTLSSSFPRFILRLFNVLKHNQSQFFAPLQCALVACLTYNPINYRYRTMSMHRFDFFLWLLLPQNTNFKMYAGHATHVYIFLLHVVRRKIIISGRIYLSFLTLSIYMCTYKHICIYVYICIYMSNEKPLDFFLLHFWHGFIYFVVFLCVVNSF